MEIIKCILGPDLYLTHVTGAFKAYQSNSLELLGSRTINAFKACFRIGLYLSPFIAVYFYRNASYASLQTSYKYVLWISVVYGIAFLIRGVGRYLNRDYGIFLHVLTENRAKPTFENRALLRRYDFSFADWPTDYKWSNDDEEARRYIHDANVPDYANRGAIYSLISKYTAKLIANTVGIRLVYPGSFLQCLLWPQLLDNRAKLINEKKAVRYKLKSYMGDTIDTIFVDRRNDPLFPRGNVLMITCEGNAGFYETGLVATALDAGYSVLGWNHPGFGGSSGWPWPQNECAAIDVVAQFANRTLGFQPSDTAVFAWSIGGFSAGYLAMNRPQIRALVLDAVFDDVLPLARHAMPSALGGVVSDVIRDYFNLHIADQIKHYDGPVSFIRRTHEEVIITDTSSAENQRKSNRINVLLKLFLRHRYPKIFDGVVESDLDAYVGKAKMQRLLDEPAYNAGECLNLLVAHFNSSGAKFPSNFGTDFDQKTKNALARYLVDFYSTDYDATHCVPLPARMLNLPYHPWDVIIEQ